MLKYFILVWSLQTFVLHTQAQSGAGEIIAKSVMAYGGEGFRDCRVHFKFRDKEFSLIHTNGKFEYYRKFESDEGAVIDILSNDGFERSINGDPQTISREMSDRYSSSVNSVMYFALLPYKLLDPAVNSTNLGKVEIAGKTYYKVRVTFQEEAGGEDFEDVFMYWFDTADFSMDYLAYSYQTEGGGLRFRRARNKRSVNGLVFQDYDNFKADPGVYEVGDLDKAYENGELELLSVIELKEVKVTTDGKGRAIEK